MAIPNRGPELLGVNITFLVTAAIAYSLRCFVRVKMVKAFGKDDWLMGLATLFFLLYVIASNTGVHFGTGRHYHDLSTKQVEKARHSWWFCYLLYTCSMTCSKLSIGFLLLRISIKRIHSWILYAAMFTSIVAGGAFFFVTVFQCSPVSYFWNRSTQSGSCVTNNLISGLAYTYSIFSIISDFTFTIIPAFIVWHLQLKRRTKLALIPLIAMGCVASAAVIARMPFLRHFNSPDFLWATVDIAIWSTIEAGLAITAGSLATLRPLYFLAVQRLGLSTQPNQQRPPHYGLSDQPIGKPTSHNEQRPDKFGTNVYNLSAVVETRASEDSAPKKSDIPKAPGWFSKGFSQAPLNDSNKTTNRAAGDGESEKSLRLKSPSSIHEEEGMHIMVSKSFYITGEERSMA